VDDLLPKPDPPAQTNMLLRMALAVWHLPREIIVALVRGYQYTLSPLVGRSCRFEPTCSHYMIGAVRKYGAVRGCCKGIWRICRCNPWGGCGHDPP
jgi:putative membrane protein insertion efficiency factor